MKRKVHNNTILLLPQTFDDAFHWFVTRAPKRYLVDIAQKYAFFIPRKNPSWNYMKFVWKTRLVSEFQTIYQRCKLLILIQAIYYKCKIQKQVYISLESALVSILENIPITMIIKKTSIIPSEHVYLHFDSISYNNTLKYNKTNENMYITSSLSIPNKDVFFDNIIFYNIATAYIDFLNPQNNCSNSSAIHHYQIWPYMRNIIRPSVLIAICPINDFVVYHVKKKCSNELKIYLIDSLIGVVSSYIGIYGVEPNW